MISSICRPANNDAIDVLIDAVPEFDCKGNVSEVFITLVEFTKQRNLETALFD